MWIGKTYNKTDGPELLYYVITFYGIKLEKHLFRSKIFLLYQ